ncbi:MAG: glycogen debranching protein GlgX [Pseudomonadota bacterium]
MSEAQKQSAPRLAAGDPSRLGASFDGAGTNFAVYSERASAMELCLFDATGLETDRFEFGECDNGVWHAYLPDLQPGTQYGFRAHGEFAPELGLYFNPAKLMLDPYARALAGTYAANPANHVCVPDGSRPRFFDRDNAAFVPRAVVTQDLPRAQPGFRPRHALAESLIYEAHARGLTRLNGAVPEHVRGTYAGLGSAALIDHLRGLGVTSLELLPVHASISESHLLGKGLGNYWGYNTLGFFAPHAGYAADPRYAREELLAAVRALHAANIEVLLDVVYNHTAEGDALGPTLSFRGLDNTSYYRLHPEDARSYINDTGCGNTLNTSHPQVQKLIIDSLRYWAEVYEVDGFRFDLAVTLGRQPEGFTPAHPLLDGIARDPVLSRLKLIAEPWDIGPGGYQVGGFGGPWAEWNDRFRDTVRAFWRGDHGVQADLSRRLHGSADAFEGSGRGPWASVNFITAHDGFTLLDTVSYCDKHNEANGEDNRDGHSHNLSDNLGEEGPTLEPSRLAARGRRQRALLATLLLARGTPMLLGGDELGNSQDGNNNAYCQDNPIGWVRWETIGTELAPINLIRRLLDLRRSLSVLTQAKYVHDNWIADDAQSIGIGWLTFDGAAMSDEDWQAFETRCFAVVWADARRWALIALNPTDDARLLRLPATLAGDAGAGWRWVLDTADAHGEPAIEFVVDAVTVSGQSLAVFVYDLPEPSA